LDTAHARKHWMQRMSRRGFTFDRQLRFSQAMGDRAGIAVSTAAIHEGIGHAPEPAWIQGRDIVAAGGRKPGPWVGELVTDALDRQYRGQWRDRTAAVQWLHARLAA